MLNRIAEVCFPTARGAKGARFGLVLLCLKLFAALRVGIAHCELREQSIVDIYNFAPFAHLAVKI